MHKKYTILYSLLILALFTKSLCAQPLTIQLDFPEQRNDTVVLAHYYNGKIFANDTTVLNENGEGQFSGNELLQEGIYTLYFDANQLQDFLLGNDQSLSISNEAGEIKVSKAKESQQFQTYVDYLKDQKAKAKILKEKLQELPKSSDSTQVLNQELAKLDNEVQAYWKKEAKKYDDTFYGKFVASNIRVQLNEYELPKEIQTNDSLLWLNRYQFNKNHYWDHFDLFDKGMWRTPTIHNHLDQYFNQILIQHPDSVLPVAIELIEQSKSEPEIFQNLTAYILNNSVQSHYMGMESVFVALAEKYYLSGDAFWASEKTLETIRREVYLRKNNLIGETARELLLEDPDGEYHSLHQISTPYTLLAFWEPNCGHCKKQIPELFEKVFMEIDPSALTIMAVNTQDNKEEWLNFIEEHELNGWINVWDPNRVSNFQINYNTRTTPMIYLLDKDKKIIAKKLTVDQARKIILEKTTTNR